MTADSDGHTVSEPQVEAVPEVVPEVDGCTQCAGMDRGWWTAGVLIGITIGITLVALLAFGFRESPGAGL